jgi:hypothetical protein
MPYTPFDKPLQAKLTTDDLKKLIEQKVTEGYYIEFKSDFPANQKIGHSVASFANTYGGWYIVGIKTNEHNVATEICGFDLSFNRNPISKVREIIKSYIDPIPIFYPQLIPLENNDRGVLVIYIPDNQETPFVTKDGRIYRRVNDSSDPVPEKHRNAIDRLVENGRDIKKQFERFCTDNRGFSKAETEGGWIKIFVSPYPLGLIDKFEEFLDDDLENFLVLSKDQLHIMKIHSDPVTGNIPFNSCQPTHCSVILRQTTPSLAAYNSLSMELFIDGRAKFFIPIQYLSDFKKMVLNQIESQEVKELLWSIWREDKEMHTNHLHFFDIAQLWLVIACLFTYYFEWLKHEPLLDELKISIIADGVWRSVPFFDDDKWAEHIKKFGLPVMLNKSVQIPSDIGHGFTIRKQNTKDDVPEWMFVICLIGLAFGLPKETFAGSFGSAIAKAAKKKG